MADPRNPELRQGPTRPDDARRSRHGPRSLPQCVDRSHALMRETPFDHDDVRSAAQAAFDIDGADSVEVVVMGSQSGITRFACSQVIQNTLKKEVVAFVRAAVG